MQTLTMNNYNFKSVDHLKYGGSLIDKKTEKKNLIEKKIENRETSQRLKMGSTVKASKIRPYETLVPIILNRSEV